MASPAHVPENLIYDFDYRAVAGNNSDLFSELKKLHDKPDLFWTTKNGGHWVATRGEFIQEILANSKDFSSRSVAVPVINRMRCLPTEADPPDHKSLRQWTNKLFSPEAVAGAVEDTRHRCREIIERVYSGGNCDFMKEFADKISLPVFLNMCGLDPDEHKVLFEWYCENPSPMYTYNIAVHFGEVIKSRQREYKDDMIGRLVTADFNGRKLTHDECVGMVVGIILGSLDTVASTMGWILYFLARNPRHRMQLIEYPELIPGAINEMIRRFSVSNTARIVNSNMNFKGVDLRQGDPISLITSLHGLDDRSFENALVVDFIRKNSSQHSAFSKGVHSCPGQALALAELKVFVEEWMRRIPHFEVAGDVRSGVKGVIYTIFNLPLSWSTAASGGR